MQFTGLKDKRGNEIYEGDVVSWEDKTSGFVQWNNDCVMFEIILEEVDNLVSASQLEKTLASDELEVIGNKYENPELLEDK